MSGRHSRRDERAHDLQGAILILHSYSSNEFQFCSASPQYSLRKTILRLDQIISLLPSHHSILHLALGAQTKSPPKSPSHTSGLPSNNQFRSSSDACPYAAYAFRAKRIPPHFPRQSGDIGMIGARCHEPNVMETILDWG